MEFDETPRFWYPCVVLDAWTNFAFCSDENLGPVFISLREKWNPFLFLSFSLSYSFFFYFPFCFFFFLSFLFWIFSSSFTPTELLLFALLFFFFHFPFHFFFFIFSSLYLFLFSLFLFFSFNRFYQSGGNFPPPRLASPKHMKFIIIILYTCESQF